MTFEEILDHALGMLQRRGRVTYRTLRRQFQLDDDALEDLKAEIIKGQRLAVDEDGEVLVWIGDAPSTPPPSTPPPAAPAPVQGHAPRASTPAHLTEKILASRAALEGERKRVTVLFADLKGSMELLADRDPEEARQLLDPVLERMMDAVHRYEGTVNQVMGDGIMALFGAPIAHEDHAVRACYAALAMQASVKQYAGEVQRTRGVPLHIRVGLNTGEVVVRSIGSDLHMDYTAVGQITHLAARMEQMAMPGSILITGDVLRLVAGYVQVNALGLVAVKGLSVPVDVYEVLGAGAVRTRLQAAAVRGLTRFVGRDNELDQLRSALERASGGQGQVVAMIGEPGVGKSRLFWEFMHSHRAHGWLILETHSVSYGRATAYLPVIDLLKAYVSIEARDEARTRREKVTGKLLTLDRTLESTLPAILALLDVPVEDPQWQALDPPQRRRRTLEALTRVLLRESQAQPLQLIFEDLHWIDSETQALLDRLVEGLPTARLLLLVNYRPEYRHGWGSKTYYTQLRLDPLPPASADEVLGALMGEDPNLAPLKPLLIARTEGNPFFLEESVRTLVEVGVLVGEPGAYRLVQALPTIQVPATVQAVLAARIDRLPPEDKRLLQTAAVIGTEVPLPLLHAIADMPEEALHRGLAHLQAAEFLYETRLFPELDYTFKHALTHEVAYGSLLHERRRALRSALLTLGDFGRILGALREAEALAERLDDPHRLAQVSLFLSAHFRNVSAHDQAIASAQRAQGLATANRDILLQALSSHLLGVSYQAQGDYRRAIDCLGQTVAALDGARLHERFGQVIPPVVLSRAWLAACHAELGTFVEGRTHGEAGVRMAEAMNHPASLMIASWGMGLLTLRQGDLPRALPLLEQAAGLCQDGDLPAYFPWMAAALGAAYTLGGRVADAVPLLTRAIDQTIAADMVGHQVLCGLSLGEAQLLAGRLEEAHALAERTLALARAHQERGHQAYALRLLGDIAAHRAPPSIDEAATHYRQVLALAEELGMRPLAAHCHSDLGTLYATTGQRQQAHAEMSAAIALYHAMEMTLWLPQAEAALVHVEGDDGL